MSLSLSLRTIQHSVCGQYAYQILTKFLPFVLLCLPTLSSHAQSVVLGDSDKTYLLFKNSAVLEVEPGQVTIDTLLQHPENYRFVSLKQKPVRPNSKQAYWFKVDLTNPTPENYFLRFFYVGDMPVRVYEVHKYRIIGSGQVDFYGAATKDLFQRGRSIVPLRLRQGQTNTLFFYVEKMGIPILHVGAMSSQMLAKDTHYQDLFYGLAYGFLLIIAAYSLLLGIRLGDRDNVFYSITAIIGGLYYDIAVGNILELTGDWVITLKDNYGVLAGIVTFISILFTLSFLQVKQLSRWLYRLGILLLWAIAIGAGGGFCVYVLGHNGRQFQFVFSNLAMYSGTIFSLLAGIVISLKRYKPAYFYTLGRLSSLISLFLFSMSFLFELFPFTFWFQNSLLIAFIAEIIFYLFGLTYKINLLKKNQDEAILEQLRLTQTNKELVETQNQVLEQKVEERTAELKASQAQLIQKEKLASLGELTAGIAHEIQNPLNFVNNFSEVSVELIDELKEELSKGEAEEAGLIADDLQQNLNKITHHGKRASNIVKGMLEHSRTGSGGKQLIHLNALADEYLRLTYQGMRAKEHTFNCNLETHFDPYLPQVTAVPQEIGRVLLNLFNNAFYAVAQRAKQTAETYAPTVTVSTSHQGNYVKIRVKDNGTGISESIREKIFQPFFTTKPTGEGTGLGLSLSYDIITKGHGGTVEVESTEGEGTTFIVKLPI